MKEVIECEKIGMAVIGLDVRHTHIHLVPLKEVGDLNFARPKLELPQERMQEIANLIASKVK
jgi:histidine triad (HIT) family protein